MSRHNVALFTIGLSSLAQEESGSGEQNASVPHVQEAQKVIGKEMRDQKAKLSSTEARLEQTEAQLQDCLPNGMSQHNDMHIYTLF